eukprot:TRINITY_DN53968_c0_g1_i1.p1 TRINITY_DN53968_c0_g1~~TRINITY_DN53968_c0_g1_i1.p1  ORF type:complete len:242 (+),score=5.34 TRINITY_DN53968_c0_g1_i1:573-1298(+)
MPGSFLAPVLNWASPALLLGDQLGQPGECHWVFHLSSHPADSPPSAPSRPSFLPVVSSSSSSQTAWYIHGLIETIWIETSRKDFGMMLGHHIISVVLTYGAYLWSVHRIGLLVTAEQDIGDIMLYMAKIYQKLFSDINKQQPLPGQEVNHTLWLSATGVVWFLTRNVSLASICWGIWTYCSLHEAWRWLLFIFLDLLLVMQIVWGGGLYYMCYTQFTAGHFHDMWHDRHPNSPQSPPKKKN